MLLLIFLLIFKRTLCQQSPLNVNKNQAQLVGSLFSELTNQISMNFTARFNIMEAYSLIFKFKRIDLTDQSSFLYLNFTATTTEPVSVKQMVLKDGKLQQQVNQNVLFKELSKVNAESYDEFRFYILMNSTKNTTFTKNAIYHLDAYFNPKDDLSSYEQLREAYFHTYLSASQKYIMLPRFLLTQKQQSKNIAYNINLFTGGISHYDNGVYFIGLLITNNYTTNSVNMWGGFSYSSSHVNRDMTTFHYSSNGISVKDTFSLIGIAPFDDTSQNVNGALNIEIISSQNTIGYSFILIKRLYDTGDKSGDQVITIKLNQQFCLALYTNNPHQTVDIKTSPIHNYLKCFNPNIGLSHKEYFMQIAFILLFALIIF